MNRVITITGLLGMFVLQSCAQKSEGQKALVPKNMYDVTKQAVMQTAARYGLKGNIKTVEQFQHLAPADTLIDFSEYEVSDLREDTYVELLAGAGMHTCKLSFDENGRLVYRVAYGERFSSDAVETDTLQYNENGDLAQIDNKLVGDDFIFSTDIVFEYDENGYLVRQSATDQSVFEYTYDEANNQVRVVRYDDGQFVYDNVYTYDPFGLNTETHHYKEDGSLESRMVIEYDELGHIEREVRYYPNDETHELKKAAEDKTIKVYRQYDANGNCTKRLVVDANDRISIRDRKFAYHNID